MDKDYKKLLEKQGYRFCGEHSAIKICDWTKKSVIGEGVCYKERFYGINCHRCCQISLAVNFCDKDCVYCWRERKNSPFTKVDEPLEVMEKASHFQKKLLDGFKGRKSFDVKKLAESRDIDSYAISLTGESLYYPKLNEFIKLARANGKRTFLVVHGGFPEALSNLEVPTQLYLSMDAPDEKMFNKIQRSMHKDAWKKYLKSLEILKKLKKKTRTVIRLTLIHDLNMSKDMIPGYAKLIEIAQPHFIEVKSYMWLGNSKKKFNPRDSPYHEEIQEFCKEFVKFIPYKIEDEQAASRVVFLKRKDCEVSNMIQKP